MKILLISISFPKEMNPFGTPLALYGLRASLMREKDINKKIDVEIKEFFLEGPPYAKLNRYKILKYIYNSNPDIIGFSCYALNINPILRLCQMIKNILPEGKIVLGGPEVSPISEKILLENPSVDVVVRGEGELTFTELVKHYLVGRKKINEISDITFRKGRKIKLNREREIIKNLDNIPSTFLNDELEIEKREFINLECSRGCFFNCHFCYYHKNWGCVRYFSLKRLEKEIKYIIEFEPKVVYLLEASFGAKRDFANKICNIISKYNKSTYFRAEVNAELMDEKIVNNFKKANINFIEVGLQSSDKETLKIANRNFSPKRFKRGFSLLRKAGICTKLELIAGLPGDNLEKLKKSIDFGLSLKPTKIDIFRLLILPGTHFYENAEKFGIKFDERAPHIIKSNKTFSSEDISKAFAFAKKVRLEYNKGVLFEEVIQDPGRWIHAQK